jgi:low affinity Fe/Cu permease
MREGGERTLSTARTDPFCRKRPLESVHFGFSYDAESHQSSTFAVIGSLPLNTHEWTMSKPFFSKIACSASRASGSLGAFVAALGVVIVWASSGPFFRFNDTWQLVINTGTTIVTFLMVFLIQHTQNADTAAIHIKLDELIRVTSNANNELLNLEEMDQERLEEIRLRYEQLAKTAAHLKAKKDLCMPCAQEDVAGV